MTHTCFAVQPRCSVGEVHGECDRLKFSSNPPFSFSGTVTCMRFEYAHTCCRCKHTMCHHNLDSTFDVRDDPDSHILHRRKTTCRCCYNTVDCIARSGTLMTQHDTFMSCCCCADGRRRHFLLSVRFWSLFSLSPSRENVPAVADTTTCATKDAARKPTHRPPQQHHRVGVDRPPGTPPRPTRPSYPS